MHCESCETLIHHTFDEIPYCPNPNCDLVKGAHDWEVVPIILQMDANRRFCEAIGLQPREQPPKPIGRTCRKCSTPLENPYGLGVGCPNIACDSVNGLLDPERHTREGRVRNSGRALTRAIRRNRY